MGKPTSEQELARVFRSEEPENLKKPSQDDLRRIAEKIWRIDPILFELKAERMGFKLSWEDRQALFGIIAEKKKRARQRRQRQLERTFQREIHKIIAACKVCSSEDIKAKLGGSIVGDWPSVGENISISLLYCGSCGLTYYNEKVAGLSLRYSQGEFTVPAERALYDLSPDLSAEPWVNW